MSDETGGAPTAARATLLIVLSACCFGSIPILTTLATRARLELSEVLFWRYGLAAALLLVIAGGLRGIHLPRQRAAALLVCAGGGQAAIAFLSLSSLRFIPAASLTFLFYTYPAWVAIIAAARGLERLTVLKVIALLCSLAGIAIMIGTPGAGGMNPVGVVLALSSALLYAIYIPMIDHLGANINPAVTSAYACIGAGAIFLGVALSSGTMSLHVTPIGFASVLIMAVVCTVLAFLAFLRGLARIGAVRTAIVSTVEPFWAALLGSVVLGQILGVRTYIGGLLIAMAVVALQIRRRAEPE